MSDKNFEFFENGLTQKDYKRLKKWGSLEEDVFNHYKMFLGRITDTLIRSVFNYPLCEHITQKDFDGETAHFYKMRVAISNPKMSPSCGARLIFAILLQKRKFVPILAYGAFEEGQFYSINGKMHPLKKSGLIKIIDEKLKTL